LILGMGGITNYFGVIGAAENAYPLKTLEHAITLRNHILCRFESAMRETGESVRPGTLTFTIVGGGASGLEFAGAVAELIKGPFREDFPDIDFQRVRVVLIEAGGRLLPDMKESASQYILERIQKMGVEVMLNTMVKQVTDNWVLMVDGTELFTDTVVWTAGIQGEPAVKLWGLPVARGGRVAVTPTLQIPEHPEVYAAGDLAYIEYDGHPLPMTAPVAIQEGTTAANNILRQIKGLNPNNFKYKDKGTMVTIGRNAAVARMGNRYFKGFFAWILWLAVHIFNLIGFRNRVFVLINWARDYFFADRPVRLILSTGSEHPCGWDEKT
jgi:NADH:ubiquinone reductase (H+-translocating)